MKILFVWILGVSILVAGCATGHCRGRKDGGGDRVSVFKSDGSRQCEKGSGLSVEKMAAELKDIEVLSQQSRNDGAMRVTLCGAPTGQINVYEIKKSDLEKAKLLGFAELKKDAP